MSAKRFQQSGGLMAADAEAWTYIARRISRLARMEARVNGSWPAGLLQFVEEAEAAARATAKRQVSPPKAPESESARVEVMAVEAAAVLGCSVQWVRRLAAAGRIEARKVGTQWVIERDSLDRATPREST